HILGPHLQDRAPARAQALVRPDGRGQQARRAPGEGLMGEQQEDRPLVRVPLLRPGPGAAGADHLRDGLAPEPLGTRSSTTCESAAEGAPRPPRSVAKRVPLVCNPHPSGRPAHPRRRPDADRMPDPMDTTKTGALPRGDALDSTILRLLMDTIPDHIYFKDRESRFVRNNAAHAASLGAGSPDACVGKTDHDFFAIEHAERALRDERRIMETGMPMIGILERITRKNGTVFWGSATKMPWRNAAGEIIGTFGLTRDITDLK